MSFFWFPDSVAGFLRTFAGFGVRFGGSTSGSVGLIAPAVAGTIDYTLPLNPTANGQGLVTTSGGIMSWAGPFAALSGSNFVGSVQVSVAGAVSSPVLSATGSILTGGTGTTNLPHFLFQSLSANVATTWNTNGTFIAANADSGFAGNFLDFRVNGGSPVFVVGPTGSLTTSGGAVFNSTLNITRSGSTSTSSLALTGTILTGGSSTTNVPHLLFQTSAATAVTTWSTGGTYVGVNSNSGFSGNFIDVHVNGAGSVFAVNAVGAITASGTVTSAGSFVSSRAATASTPVFWVSGTLLTGATGTTNFPMWFSQTAAATAVTTWNTAGTYFGVNADNGFSGSFIDCHTNGASSLFRVDAFGAITTQSNFNTSGNGGTSTSVMNIRGTVFTGGTGTTTYPQYFAQASAATLASTWSTSGTYIGVNANSGFNGNFLDFRVNGGASLFSVSSSGTVTTSNPAGGSTSATNWQLGNTVATSGLTLKASQYVEVNIGGTIVKLATVN